MVWHGVRGLAPMTLSQMPLAPGFLFWPVIPGHLENPEIPGHVPMIGRGLEVA